MTNVPKEKSVEEEIISDTLIKIDEYHSNPDVVEPTLIEINEYESKCWKEALTTYRQDIIAKRDEEIVESVKFIKTREMNVGENRSKYLAFQRGENHMKVKVLKLTEQSETDFCKKLEAEGKDTFQVAKALAELRNHPTKDTDQSLNNKKE